MTSHRSGRPFCVRAPVWAGGGRASGRVKVHARAPLVIYGAICYIIRRHSHRGVPCRRPAARLLARGVKIWVNAAERLSRSSLSGHFSHHHTAVDRSLTALCTELKGQLYIDGGAMEVVTGLFTKCMCFHLSSCYICMHPLAFRAVSMQDLANAPALRPRGPLCALCVSRQTKGHRGRKIPGKKWAVHMDPGEVPSACGPRAPPAWRRRPHGYGVYGTANSYSVLRTCSAYGRCVVRLWAAHVCRSFLSDRPKCSTYNDMYTYGIEGTPIVSNMRLSRGVLDSRGVDLWTARPTGWRVRREQRRETGRRANALAA